MSSSAPAARSSLPTRPHVEWAWWRRIRIFGRLSRVTIHADPVHRGWLVNFPRRRHPSCIAKIVPNLPALRYALGLWQGGGVLLGEARGGSGVSETFQASQTGKARELRLLAFLLLRLLDEFLDHPVALQLGNMVDEQHAVRVVDFMLQGGRHKPLRLNFLWRSVAIEIAGADARRPLDLFVIFGDRQAAFLVNRLLLRRPDDLRIDKKLRLRRLALLGEIEHDDALGDADLNRGETDSRRVMHGLDHLVHQLAQGVVDGLYRLARLAQPRVGQNDDRTNGHGRRTREGRVIKVGLWRVNCVLVSFATSNRLCSLSWTRSSPFSAFIRSRRARPWPPACWRRWRCCGSSLALRERSAREKTRAPARAKRRRASRRSAAPAPNSAAGCRAWPRSWVRARPILLVSSPKGSTRAARGPAPAL